MNKPLLSLLKELKQGQRFDNKSFEDAGCLIYDLDELAIKEGVLNETNGTWPRMLGINISLAFE